MTEEKQISGIIEKATDAINSRSEAIRLLMLAHKQVADYTHIKSKEIFDKSRAIAAFTQDFTKEFVAKCGVDAKPHYDRAQAAMLAVEKIKEQFDMLSQQYEVSGDHSRRKRLYKMMKLKQMELEQCGQLQDVAETMAQEEYDKLSAIEPLISKAYKTAINSIDKCTPLINFSISISAQEYILRYVPVIAALAITLFVDFLTGPFENVLKPIDVNGYHNSAILILFAIQWLTFDKAKEWLQDKLHRRAIIKIKRTFIDNITDLVEVETNLAAAKEICIALNSQSFITNK